MLTEQQLTSVLATERRMGEGGRGQNRKGAVFRPPFFRPPRGRGGGFFPPPASRPPNMSAFL